MLGGAVLFWVAGFDIIYACQDADFDRQHGLYSIPAGWGIARALRVAAVCHAVSVALLAALPFAYSELRWIYWTGVAAVSALLVYEHVLVRPTDLGRVNVAFFNVNVIIGLGLFAVVSLELLTPQIW
jgi:4-hydroxybenzoate polyprenyltransferase